MGAAQTADRKSKRDRWLSMAELRSFGMDECSQLAQLFNLILRTAKWPSQLRHAYVALLAKVPFPKTAKNARPITILPGIHRLFGKIMTQKIFKAALPRLPPDLFGSAPGKSTMDARGKYNVSLKSRCMQVIAFQVPNGPVQGLQHH